MYTGLTIDPPFFEIGPKAFMYGDRLMRLAQAADEASAKYDVRIILTPQPTDIYLLARETSHVLIFAQHMDPIVPGRGNGYILPEALKAAGAVGVILNHAERPMTLADLARAIRRADEVGLATMVCADSIREAEAIAQLSPNIIVPEPTELIGTGQTSDEEYVIATTSAIRRINPSIQVLQAAGISSGRDVHRVILAGADATGTTSGIMRAEDPEAMLEEMVRAVREAWDERHKK